MATKVGRQISRRGGGKNTSRENQQRKGGATGQKQTKTSNEEGQGTEPDRTQREETTRTKTHPGEETNKQKKGAANKPKKQREEGGQVVERLVAIHNFRLRFAVRSTKVWYPAVCACVFHLIVLSACINGGSHLVG